MNKSVPTLLGIVIILLVVILVVLVVNYQVTKGIGEGGRVKGTVGGEILTGEEAPEEFIGESELGGRAEQEAQQLPARARERGAEARQEARERREQVEETGEPVKGGPLVEPGP